jgi:hypothetical protein
MLQIQKKVALGKKETMAKEGLNYQGITMEINIKFKELVPLSYKIKTLLASIIQLYIQTLKIN